MVSPIATSEMPNAVATRMGRSARGTPGNCGSGKPCGRAPTVATPCAGRLKRTVAAIAATTAKRIPGESRRPAAQAKDNPQGEQANGEGPEVGLPQLRHNCADLLEKAIGVNGVSEQFWQLTNHDRDRQARKIAHAHGLGDEVCDESKSRDRSHHADHANQQRQHPSQRHSLVHAARRQGQNRRGDHRSQG